MKYLIYIILLLSVELPVLAQPLTIDHSFQPYFDIRQGTSFPGKIYDTWENPKNAKIFIAGEFDLGGGGIPIHGALTKLNRTGSYDIQYSAFLQGGGPALAFFYVNDTIIAVSSRSGIRVLDTLGNLSASNITNNYYRTVRCVSGNRPYFYNDGSVLLPNGLGAFGCDIYSYNDTFPHRYIVKVNPQGFYDSSFQVFPNHEPQGFIPYDSNRLFVVDRNFDMTHFNGVRINGLCRIFEDGTLDTTFHNPIDINRTAPGSWGLNNVQEDGSFFLVGGYYIKNDTNKVRYLAKFKANGELDSSFKWTSTLQNTRLSWASSGGPVVNTHDGGYIMAGAFTHFNGYNKHNLVKLDSNGFIESQYFNTMGPDSSSATGFSNYPLIHGITKSAYGGYYVYGDFLKWDGQASQPIVRIYDENYSVGLENHKAKSESIDLFPNPVKAQLNLQLNERQKIRSVRVFDLLGKNYPMALQNKKYQLKLDVADLPKGIYLLQVETENGLLTEKFVKE